MLHHPCEGCRHPRKEVDAWPAMKPGRTTTFPRSNVTVIFVKWGPCCVSVALVGPRRRFVGSDEVTGIVCSTAVKGSGKSQVARRTVRQAKLARRLVAVVVFAGRERQEEVGCSSNQGQDSCKSRSTLPGLSMAAERKPGTQRRELRGAGMRGCGDGQGPDWCASKHLSSVSRFLQLSK